MGKKRKASSQTNASHSHEAKPESSNLTINTYEDIADSEDEFLINRDRIALEEGPDAKRRRKASETGMVLFLLAFAVVGTLLICCRAITRAVG